MEPHNTWKKINTKPMLKEFRDKLSAFAENIGFNVGHWRGLSRASRNVIALTKENETVLLYVKVSSSEPAFWGLTANRITELNNSLLSWQTVLLKSSDEGFIIPSGVVISMTENGRWTLSGDGEYKINEHADLENIDQFGSFDEFVGQLLKQIIKVANSVNSNRLYQRPFSC